MSRGQPFAGFEISEAVRLAELDIAVEPDGHLRTGRAELPDAVVGPGINVTLWSYSGFDVQQKTLELVQPDLNKIGLKVDIQTIDFGALQPKLEAGETGFDYMRWTFYDQSILSQLFKTPGWVKQTSDPELDKLLAVADTTVDPEARIKASHDAMVYVLQHAIIAPINTDWFQSAVNGNVHDYHWDANDNERLIDVWLK
jgi:ABC-type transport system substrate-binding protein